MNSELDAPAQEILFIHSSNEMYGADKILIEVLNSIPDLDRDRSSVWLPDDLPSSENRLGEFLDSLRIKSESRPVPVLRRKYLTVAGFFPLVRKIWITFRTLRRSKIQVVYCTTSAMVLCLSLARLAGVKRVVLHMQEIWSPREATILGFLARGAHEVFCISTAARDSLPAYIRRRAVLLTNAHSELNTSEICEPSRTGPLEFVVASRWNSWKGHRGLLAAWNAELSPGNLTILGGAPVMGAGVDVRELVSQLKHREAVSIVGEVEDISSYIDAADFLVLPSDKPEPFGLVLVESFARGRAVIASDAGGVLDIVTNGHDGLLYPIGDASGLATLLSSVDKDAARRMGTNARQTYEERFSINAYRSRFQELWTVSTNDSESDCAQG